MGWIPGFDTSSQPAARIAMTPAGCIDKEGRGQITYTPWRKTQTHTCTHILCDDECSLFWGFLFASPSRYLLFLLVLYPIEPFSLLSSSSGHGPRTGLITPSFGMKGNGSAVVPRCPVPSRPVPQPHPKDEDTLVQMAEHIPAGTRTPMCGHCNMVIRWGTDAVANMAMYQLTHFGTYDGTTDC